MRVLLLPLAIVSVVLACAPQGSPSVQLPITAAAPTWPLRGTSAPDADTVRRRPLVVKVPNDPAARPQTGLADADLIVEVPVEGGLTRLAVVFQSADPARVGPVRSARQADIEYIGALHAILAHVGASEAVTKLVRDASGSGSFVDVDEFEHPDAFERTSDRVPPYNAYTTGSLLRTAAGAAGSDKVTVPALKFGDMSGGADGSTLTVPYAEPVTYQYDISRRAYHRRYDSGPATTDARAGEVLPENVVIVRTDVREIAGTADAAGAPSLDYRGTGTGPVIVLRDGMRFDGTWSRDSGGNYALKDGTGRDILLKPGLTWMHVVPMDFAF